MRSQVLELMDNLTASLAAARAAYADKLCATAMALQDPDQIHRLHLVERAPSPCDTALRMDRAANTVTVTSNLPSIASLLDT